MRSVWMMAREAGAVAACAAGFGVPGDGETGGVDTIDVRERGREMSPVILDGREARGGGQEYRCGSVEDVGIGWLVVGVSYV